MTFIEIDLDEVLLARVRATACEEGMGFSAYLSRAIRRQVENDNINRAARRHAPPPPRCDPGE